MIWRLGILLLAAAVMPKEPVCSQCGCTHSFYGKDSCCGCTCRKRSDGTCPCCGEVRKAG